MTDIAVFSYSDIQVRTVLVDGEPWFVIADLCRVLALSNPTVVADRLDADDLSTAEVIDSMGRTQAARITNEAGAYHLVFMSRKPEAKAFKRWITHEVIPAIRKTGRYETTPAIPQTYAAALQLAADQALQLEAQSAALAEAAPKAEAWDHLASANGDYLVRDAAKILSRHPLVKIGERRLFALMAREGWVYRRPTDDHRWAVYQRAVDAGWLTEMASSHYHPRSGELVLDPPQVRVMPKGLAELQKRLTGTQQQIAAA